MKALSHNFSDMRGSVAGITYSKGLYPGIIGRAKVSPVNPNTTLQSVGRSAFSGAAQLWNDMSPADRLIWNEYAASVSYPGTVGPYTISGRLSMMASMQFAYWADDVTGLMGDVDPDPPVIDGRLNVVNIAVVPSSTAGETGIALNFESTGAESIVGVLQVSRAFSDTRNTFKGPFRSDNTVGLVLAAPASGHLEILGLAEDRIYFSRFRAITEDAPHRISTEFYNRHVANLTAAP